MHRNRHNYVIYITMMIVFGALIFFALAHGEKFSYIEPALRHSRNVSPFGMFLQVITHNLQHPIVILLFQIIVILVVVRLFSFLFKYIGQPGVIGEIVAGIALGPSLLGHFFPEIAVAIFPPDSLGNLELLSQIGLVLFMFVIGMELDFGILKNKMNETLVISHAGIVVPFFLGILSSFWVYEEYASTQTDFLPFALFMGISMSITAFPVLARIVQERNMAKTQSGILALASAANDDVTAWCLLAIVIAIAQAGTFVSALFTIALTVVYILFMFILVMPFLKKIGNIYANKEVINKSFVGFIFLILLLSSAITETIGIHALFGAFMAGVVMPSNIGFRKVMMEKVEDVATVIFLPLFFAYTGLNTQIGAINSPELWGVCFFLVAVSITGKLGGCTLAARSVGEKWKDSIVIGTLMNTRGLMELVALNIGREMGILSAEVFAILVIMALTTTFMTTPILHWVERWKGKDRNKMPGTRRLILSFGRPETGKLLLSVANILFGQQLKKINVIAAHFTLGTDLNPVKAQQYARDSFIPVSKQAAEYHIRLDKRYKVTDKLNQEIVQLVHNEQSDLLLLGAGPHFMAEGQTNNHSKGMLSNLLGFSRMMSTIREKTMHLPGSLLREKIEWIMDHTQSPVAVFENRELKKITRVSLLIDTVDDLFLLGYADGIFSGKIENLTLRVSEAMIGNEHLEEAIEAVDKRYVPKLGMDTYALRGVVCPTGEDLLILSYDACKKIATNAGWYDCLPSFLTIRPAKKSFDTES